MKIGLILPTVFASKTLYPTRIFAPRDLLTLLADGLVKRGHKVYVFSTPDFETQAEVISSSIDPAKENTPYHKFRNLEKKRRKWQTDETIRRSFELDVIINAFTFAKKGEIDILHNYHDSIFFTVHYFNLLFPFPVLYSLHDPLPPRRSIEYHKLLKFRTHPYIALSDQMKKSDLKLNFAATIYHGLDLSKLAFESNKYLDYIAFIGRIVPEKGVSEAVAVAQKLGLKLYIASSKVDTVNYQYYRTKVKPYLDTKSIREIGYVNDQEKSKFLGLARCLLFPIKWEEPFGMVMIESMACGTPVVAFAQGSVPEVIKDGETGFIVNLSEKDKRGNWLVKKTGLAGLTEAVEIIYNMEERKYRVMRSACRTYVEENFSIERMVERYEKVYGKVLGDR